MRNFVRNLFSQKKAESKPTTKSLGFATGNDSFISSLLNTGNFDIGYRQLLGYFSKVAPIFDGVDRITSEIKTINPFVENVDTGEIIPEHPLLQKLRHPNSDVTYQEFIEKFASFFLLLGNNFTIATGPIDRPPLELFIINPIGVSADIGNDGFIDSFTINTNSGSFQVFREEVDGRTRFFNVDRTIELYHTRSFNPFAGGHTDIGMPRLNPIFFEIEQYLNSNIHNLSRLRRGSKPSAIFTVDKEKFDLTDDQLQQMRNEIMNFFSGSQNAGRALMFTNELQVIPFETSSIDMDFLNAKLNVTDAIYNNLRVPLPLVSSAQMTFNNLETATLSLYDNAVIPNSTLIFNELTDFLMPRYPDSDDLQLSLDENDISALEIRRAETLRRREITGIYTTNELRETQGLSPVRNGDTVFIQSNEVPLGRVQPAEELPEENEILTDDEVDRHRLVSVLRKQVDKFGKRKFTEEQIQQLIDSNNG